MQVEGIIDIVTSGTSLVGHIGALSGGVTHVKKTIDRAVFGRICGIIVAGIVHVFNDILAGEVLIVYN